MMGLNCWTKKSFFKLLKMYTFNIPQPASSKKESATTASSYGGMFSAMSNFSVTNMAPSTSAFTVIDNSLHFFPLSRTTQKRNLSSSNYLDEMNFDIRKPVTVNQQKGQHRVTKINR